MFGGYGIKIQKIDPVAMYKYRSFEVDPLSSAKD